VASSSAGGPCLVKRPREYPHFSGFRGGLHLGRRFSRLGCLAFPGIYGSPLPAYIILSGRNSALANGGVCSRSGVHVHHERSDPRGTSLTMQATATVTALRLRLHSATARA